MAKSPYKKKSLVKRAIGAAGKFVKNRYASKNYGSNIKNIISDVNMMKNLMNVEKKRFTSLVIESPVGQVSANANGFGYHDLTPLPEQGVTYQTRNGASIKLTSMYLQFQFYHQTNTSASMRIVIYIVKCIGRANQTVDNAVTEFLNMNPFINFPTPTIYDLNCSRNPDYFKEYAVIKKKYVTLRPDQIVNQQYVTDVVIPLKFKNHHIRYDKDSSTATGGQIYMFVLADSGNRAATASTLTGIPIKAALTGALYSMNVTSYYVDN